MIIKGIFIRFPRTRFATRLILFVFALIFIQSLILLRLQSPSNSGEDISKNEVNGGIDLSYADIDINNLENQVLEDLSNGNIPGDDSEKDQFKEEGNDSSKEGEKDNQEDNDTSEDQPVDDINMMDPDAVDIDNADYNDNNDAPEEYPEIKVLPPSNNKNINNNINNINNSNNNDDNDTNDNYIDSDDNTNEDNNDNINNNIENPDNNNDNDNEYDNNNENDIHDNDNEDDIHDNDNENGVNENENENEYEYDNNNGNEINDNNNINNPIPNVEKEEADKAFNKDDQENNKPKGWKLDEKWEWCRNISIVYTWVNGSDPNHQEIKSHYNGGIKKADQRDRSMDELRYSLRSLEKNLPWHEGTIFIVSPNQVPYWLNVEHPRIKIIDQASLLPPSVNPTFNSFSIEFYLDKIPGLTERFIQLNDDYFFKRYIHPSFFFNKKRFPNFYYGRTHVHKGFKEADQISILENATWIKKYWGSIFHTNGVIKEKYGDEAHIIMLQHAPYVWYRDIFEPMRQYYGQYLIDTLSHKFRHSRDLIPTYAHQQFIINVASKPDFKLSEQVERYPELEFDYHPNKNAPKTIKEYGYRALSRNTVKNYIRFGTVLDDKLKSLKLFNIIKSGPYLMFNLNDDYTTEEPGYWLLSFMNEMFPYYSAFENDKPKDLDEKAKNKINMNDFEYVHIA